MKRVAAFTATRMKIGAGLALGTALAAVVLWPTATLDKGILRLGDNTVVNFEKTLIFFTSNLGAREMLKEIIPDIGFHSLLRRPRADLSMKLESIALGAVRKRFSPEFVNRIDAVVTYQPLDMESMTTILDHDMKALQRHVNSRLGESCFTIEVSPEARGFLLARGGFVPRVVFGITVEAVLDQ